jgi:probable addiction module antidote protein
MARKLKQVRWSYAEDRRLLKLAKSSKSPEEIARLLNRSPAAVYKMAIRLGVPLRLKAKGK